MKSCLRIQVDGLVQGVGLRPWVARLARSSGVGGSVRNVGQSVEIVATGEIPQLREFQHALQGGAPPAADIHHMVVHAQETDVVDAVCGEFQIAPSCAAQAGALAIPRDHKPCVSCLKELKDLNDRRYRYPFISCSDCGPRFTLLTAMPFDRACTSMADFALCTDCQREYVDPHDRRCHAQTIACERCGPQLWLQTPAAEVSGNADALAAAVQILRQGGVLALKGVGGYQLLALAAEDAAITRLRSWKQRQRKPLAVMLPDLQSVERVCQVSSAERDALTSAAAPIVILSLRTARSMSSLLAPGLNNLGVMLPASPLHQLLADDIGRMLVVTSANRRGAPLLIADDVAVRELSDIADGVLGHDRPIVRMADDSVVRFAGDQQIVIRHARGLAPTSVPVAASLPPGIAYGGHMKAAPAIYQGGSITLLQHIGDLDGLACQERLLQAPRDFKPQPQWLATDAHPDYASTGLIREIAQRQGLVQQTVYHHVAHVLAVAAEHQLAAPILGVAFDGTGLGADGRIWGGEFIVVRAWRDNTEAASQPNWQRVGTLLDFPLPGGEAAIREPRRAALGMAWRLCDGRPEQIPNCVRQLFTAAEWGTLISMLEQQFNCPMTTSVGRMFDALAACLGLVQIAEYDGEAAMLLEAAAQVQPMQEHTAALEVRHGVWDWRSVIRDLLELQATGDDAARVAAKWHATVAQLILQMAQSTGLQRVVLSGGVFQNARLLSQARVLLQQAGMQVYCHQNLPANDGSLGVGQAFAAAHAGLPTDGCATLCV